MCRLINNNPSVKITGSFPYTTISKTVFNSQNTFIHRSCLPNYAVLAKADRMDDIWGGIIFQEKTYSSIVFNKPSVYQRRNYHNIVNDLERELLGYYKTIELLNAKNSDSFNEYYNFLDLYKANCLM